jgi:hypothetical protein
MRDLDALDVGVTKSQTGPVIRWRADIRRLEKKSSDFNGFCWASQLVNG